MKLLVKWLPWCFLALFGAEIVAILMPRREGEFHLREFGRLPVLMNGRIQPFDSVGRNSLLQIRSTGDVPLEQVPAWRFWHHPQKLKPSAWLAEVLFEPDRADTRPIFLIHHPELLAELNLADKGIDRSGLRYFTFDQLRPVLDEIQKQGTAAQQVDEKMQTAFQKQAAKLLHAVSLYQSLKAAARPPIWEDFQKDLAAFEKLAPAGIEAVRARDANRPFDPAVFDAFWPPMSQIFTLARDPDAGRFYPLVVPPYAAGQKPEEWSSICQALVESLRGGEAPAPVNALAAIASAYHRGQAADFNRAVADYGQWLDHHCPAERQKGRAEFFFNDTKPFLHAMIIDLFAFLLAAGAVLTLVVAPGLSESLRRSAFYLLLLAAVVHTLGLVFRMWLEARPPVTNLYSSAVFIGWGTVVLGLVLERIYRVGLGSLVASLVGCVTLIIAQNLAVGGDTMEMMRAVLDTNFWLATHVVTITMGYAATFCAGFLAILYILLGLCTPVLDEPLDSRGATPSAPKDARGSVGDALAKMVYGIICFAALFSFVGTVLGGIWADQAWGRFWGWDPKENGALLIVLWNAVILHVRWGRLLDQRGIMSLAVFGNIVTAFSWFGVNMLGIGLHSYGFMDAAFKWLAAFVLSQLLIIGLGSLPLRMWRSARETER